MGRCCATRTTQATCEEKLMAQAQASQAQPTTSIKPIFINTTNL